MIEIVNKLNFGKHVPAICQKANNQLNAISRITAVVWWQKEIEILINYFACSSSTANLLYETLQTANGLKK